MYLEMCHILWFGNWGVYAPSHTPELPTEVGIHLSHTYELPTEVSAHLPVPVSYGGFRLVIAKEISIH